MSGRASAMKIPSSLKKDTVREIRKGKSRFISIVVLVALAVLFLFGLRMAAPDMEATADAYYDAQNMMDVRIVSTLGITDDDVGVLAAVDGVADAEGSYGVDAVASGSAAAGITVHTMSISETINVFDIVEGRMPQSADECIAEELVLEDLGLSIGDTIVLDPGDGDYEDALARTEYTVVGICRTPLYVSTSKGTSTLGSGKIIGIVGLMPETYTLDYYTDLYVTVEGALDLQTYSDAYEEYIEAFTDSLEELAEERAAVRLEEVRSEALGELDDGWEEYEDAKAEADEELADAAQELADARTELDDGWAEYEDGISEVEESEGELADARTELTDAESELADALAELTDAKTQLDDAASELSDAQSELSDAKTQLDEALQTLEDGEADYAQGLETYQDSLASYESAKAEYDAGVAEYEESLSAYEAGVSAYEEGLAEYEEGLAEYEEGKAAYDAGLAEYNDGYAQYEEGLETYNESYAQYEESLAEYEAGYAAYEEGLSEYEAGYAAYEEGLAEYEAGYAAYEEGLAEYEAGYAQYEEGLAEYEAGYAAYEEGLAEYEAGYTAYEEGLAEYEAGYAQYEQGESEYAAGLAEYEASEEEYEAAQEELAQLAAMLEAGYVTQEVYDAALSELEEAQTALAEAKAQLTQNRAVLDETASELAAAKETLDETAAELSAAKSVLDETASELAAAKETLDGTAAELAAARSVLDETATELAAAKETLDETASELTAAKETLDETKTQLDEAKTQLDEAAQELTAAKETLDETKAQLEEAKAQLDASEEALTSAQSELAAAKETLDETKTQLDEAKVQLDEAAEELASGETQLADAKAQLDEAAITLADARAELDSGWAEYEDGLAEYEDGVSSYEEGLAEYEEGLAEYEEGLAEYEDGLAEYEEGLAEYEDGLSQLEDAKDELADALITLQDGETEYADGLSEYEDAEAEALEELDDALEELEDAQKTVDEIDECEWYVLDRQTNIGYVGFEQESERMSRLADFFPLIFFLVAALVCLTTMTRMVEEQRIQIGSLKALGYSKGQIAFKYVAYGLAASLIGSVIGLLIGGTLIPAVLLWAWSIMYEIPGRVFVIRIPILLFSVGAAMLCCVAAVLAAALSALRATPATLMRPRAPKAGKRVWLEYMTPVWKRFNFSMKVTARNLFRYQKRFWMTVIGIAGCTALVLTGFGLSDSINAIMDKQFGEISLYDATVAVSEAPDEELLGALDDTQGLADYLGVYLSAVDFETDAYTVSGYVMSAPDAQSLDTYIDFHTRKGDEEVPLTEDGVIISEKTATMLEVEIGDTVTVKIDDDAYTVTITGICENYLYHYIYMTDSYYEAVFGEAPEVNTLMVHYTEETDAQETASEAILKNDTVTSITQVSDNQKILEDQMKAVNACMVIIIGAAAALAFVVLFNLSNINITERSRELATLKVLGFRYPEMNAYVMRESVILTLFGMLAGLIAGKYLHLWLMTTVEIEIAMFGREINAVSYLYAVVLTVAFSLIANKLAGRKLRKIDMVESLKAVE